MTRGIKGSNPSDRHCPLCGYTLPGGSRDTLCHRCRAKHRTGRINSAGPKKPCRACGAPIAASSHRYYCYACEKAGHHVRGVEEKPAASARIISAAWAELERHPEGITKLALAQAIYAHQSPSRMIEKVEHLLAAMEANGYRVAEDDAGRLMPCYQMLDWPWDHANTRRAQIVARRLP